MSSMNIFIPFSAEALQTRDVQPFVLFRDQICHALEDRRQDLERMYAKVMGRPEIDPVFLTGVTLLQMMERLPDRQAIMACRYDAWEIGSAL